MQLSRALERVASFFHLCRNGLIHPVFTAPKLSNCLHSVTVPLVNTLSYQLANNTHCYPWLVCDSYSVLMKVLFWSYEYFTSDLISSGIFCSHLQLTTAVPYSQTHCLSFTKEASRSYHHPDVGSIPRLQLAWVRVRALRAPSTESAALWAGAVWIWRRCMPVPGPTANLSRCRFSGDAIYSEVSGLGPTGQIQETMWGKSAMERRHADFHHSIPSVHYLPFFFFLFFIFILFYFYFS